MHSQCRVPSEIAQCAKMVIEVAAAHENCGGPFEVMIIGDDKASAKTVSRGIHGETVMMVEEYGEITAHLLRYLHRGRRCYRIV